MAAHEDELCVALTRIALAGDGVVLGIGMSVLALRTWLKYRAHSRALKELEETPLSRIADLRSLVDGSNQERARIILHDDDSERVETNPKFPFSSLLWQRRRSYTTQPQELSTKQQQEKAAAAAAIVMVRGRVQSKACVEESKHETEHDTGALTAENVDEKAVYLERTQTCLYNEWRGILGWGYDWRGLLGWGSRKEQVTVSRRKVGLLDEEKILPLGREITAVGTLSVSLDGTPVIKPSGCLPVFLTDLTRDQLLLDLANGRNVLFWMGIAATIVATGVLGYALIKNWAKWKQRHQRRQQRDDESRQDRLIDDAGDDMMDIPDGELCVVCLLRRRRAAFIYCGHRVCCVTCAQQVEQGTNPRCPVCRQTVSGIVRVFDS
ncbi:hypothetical protein BDL97_05G093200 [Sphagnum fallax]|nr:hypothetical protein BDL97_05G093200 [Sphagnum fallax]